jgi:hypothetical protein
MNLKKMFRDFLMKILYRPAMDAFCECVSSGIHNVLDLKSLVRRARASIGSRNEWKWKDWCQALEV